MGRRKRRKFTAEQKAEAVRIAQNSTKSITQVARDLDLAPSALNQWIRQSEVEENKRENPAVTSADQDELEQLRKQVRHLEQENAFLKNHPAAGGRSLLEEKLSLM